MRVEPVLDYRYRGVCQRLELLAGPSRRSAYAFDPRKPPGSDGAHRAQTADQELAQRKGEAGHRPRHSGDARVQAPHEADTSAVVDTLVALARKHAREPA